jgi:Protein of unknown function (DUF3102)
MRSDTSNRSDPNHHKAGVPIPTLSGTVTPDHRVSLRHDGHTGQPFQVANQKPRSDAPTTSSRAADDAQTFSYASMPQALADELRTRAERIRRGLACDTMKVIEIGNELRHAKARLPHGAFLAWAEHEIGISARAAQLYMSASAWIKNRDEKFSRLPISIIYLLAARTTPAEIADEFARKVAMDAPVTYAGIRERIEAVRQAKRQAVAAAGRAEDEGRLSSKRVPGSEEEGSGKSLAMEAAKLVTRSLCPEDLGRLQRLLLQPSVYSRLGCLGRQVLEMMKSIPIPAPQ